MSTPYSSGTPMGNAGASAGNPDTLYNSISSQGMPPDNSQQQAQKAPEQKNPAEQAIQRFGQVFDQFNQLTQMPEYSAASKEAKEVQMAMKNWLEAVVAATSKLGGESPASV